MSNLELAADSRPKEKHSTGRLRKEISPLENQAMSQLINPTFPGQLGPVPSPHRTTKPVDEPFYGYRYLKRTKDDGSVTYEEVPLTKEDLLYPEEGDHHVVDPRHDRDFRYLGTALETYYSDVPSVVVLNDQRIDWGVKSVPPLGPDITVMSGVKQWLKKPTFSIRAEGGKPLAVIEITSTSTRENDVGIKLELYLLVGVQVYVVIDRGDSYEAKPEIRAYRRVRGKWSPLTPDEHGKFDLAPLPFKIGIENDRPWLYLSATDERLKDHEEAIKSLQEAEAKAKDDQTAMLALQQEVAELKRRLGSG